MSGTNQSRKPANLKPAAHRWVLVVEDDPDLRSLVVEDLKRQSYRVVDTGTVSDALQKLKNQRFDCIVLDLKIEQRLGEEIVDFLRSGSEPSNRYTPILVMSGHMDIDRVKRLSAHVHGVLVKPFDRKALVEKVQTLMEAVAAKG